MIDHNIIPDNTDYKKLYYSLVMLVGNKYPGESRHDTAARYIMQAESQNNTPQCAKST